MTDHTETVAQAVKQLRRTYRRAAVTIVAVFTALGALFMFGIGGF